VNGGRQKEEGHARHPAGVPERSVYIAGAQRVSWGIVSGCSLINLYRNPARIPAVVLRLPQRFTSILSLIRLVPHLSHVTMLRMGWAMGVLLLIHGLDQPVWAQEGEARDSLKTYDLSEIVIGGESRQEDRARRAFRVELADLARQDVPDVASTLRLLPSASIQTNSRGETLVYIRAAGERQVAVFLDGAPLNVAWDNRIDLGLVPSTILGGMSVERGAVGPAWGTNTSGGALNLQSRRLASDGSLAEATIQAGTAGSRQVRALYASRQDGVGILFGGTMSRMDGIPVPDAAHLPFEPATTLRSNTDREEANAYLRLDREGAKGRIGLTIMHARASKGVAPEGHLDPEEENVRYWRYPLWQHSMAILNGVRSLSGVRLSGSAWLSRFRQDIEDHASIDYRVVTSRQEDTDRGVGARLILEDDFVSLRWRLIAVVSSASHRQIDRDLTPGSQQGAPAMLYRNLLHTLGAEMTSGVGYPGHWVVGVAWDGMRTPETGVFPSPGGFNAWAANAEWHRDLGRRSTLKLNGGSKPRFPTMRELFGTALDRFNLNPDLRPERTWILEGGWQHTADRWHVETMVFLQRTMDTIDQENVIVGGQRKRQRINLDGSRVHGVEWQAGGNVASGIRLTGHATWMRPVAIQKDGTTRRLTEKPEVLTTLASRFGPFRGISLDVTGVHTGRAYGLAPDNALRALPSSWRVNVRLAAQRFFADSGLFLQMYAGVDNLTDALQLPQLGLPDAGRTARIGMSLSR